MAYRSDVRLVLSPIGYKELKKYVNDNLSEKNKEYNLLQNTDVEIINDEQIYIGWNAAKWYEYSDFEEVNAIMNGLKYLTEKDLSYNYVRIGEEVDDYDEKYNNGDNDNKLDYPQIERYFDDDYFQITETKDVEI